MNSNTGDIILRRMLNQNGYHFLDVPVDQRLGPSIIAVRTADGRTWLIDTSTVQGSVFEIPYSTSNLLTNLDPTSLSRIPPNLTSNSTLGTSNGSERQRRLNEWLHPPNSGGTCWADSDSGKTPPSSAWSTTASAGGYQPPPPKKSNVIGGLRFLTAAEMKELQEPYTPTKFNADTYFNDGLYLSLQGDILPQGANPLDDYLNSNVDTRRRIFLNAAIDNQGCYCEHTDLDRYLGKNKNVFSALSLRATLSDECKKMVHEPTDTRHVKDQMLRMQGQVENWLKQMRDLNAQKILDAINPWNSFNEEQDVMAIE